MVKWLVKKGLAVDTCSNQGDSALISAIMASSHHQHDSSEYKKLLRVIDTLLELHALNVPQPDHIVPKSALGCAALLGDLTLVTRLVKYGFDVNQTDTCSPSQWAKMGEKSNPDVVEYLLEHGATQAPSASG